MMSPQDQILKTTYRSRESPGPNVMRHQFQAMEQAFVEALRETIARYRAQIIAELAAEKKQ